MMVEWFTCWAVSAKRYRKALTDRRGSRKINDEMSKYIHYRHQEDGKTVNALKGEIDEKQTEHDESRSEIASALNDERLRFIEELAAKDAEIKELTKACKERQDENDLADRANDGLVKVNELLHSQMEMAMGKNGAEKIHYLNEQNKNPLQGLL